MRDGLKDSVVRWGNRRRSLADEYARIMLVQQQADALVEELRRRRDGEPHRMIDVSALRGAILEAGSREREGQAR